jgi:hypothetical protein
VPSATEVITSTPVGSPTDGRTIGLADNGRTIQFSVGERFGLVLGADFDWTLGPIDESVVQRVRNITVVRGGQGVFNIVGPGTTLFSAVGDPPCRKATPPCGAPSLLFQVSISAR